MNPKDNLVSLSVVFFLIGVGGGLFWEKELYFSLKNFGLVLAFFVGSGFFVGQILKKQACLVGSNFDFEPWAGLFKSKPEIN